MDKKECVINPKTGRAVKADSKIGKMILEGKTKAEPKKNVPHTMYKDAKAVRPNRADFEKKKELEKVKVETKNEKIIRPNRTDFIQKQYLNKNSENLVPKTAKKDMKLDLYIYAKPTNDFKTNVDMMVDHMKDQTYDYKTNIMRKYLSKDYIDTLDKRIQKLGETNKIVHGYDIMDKVLIYILNKLCNLSKDTTDYLHYLEVSIFNNTLTEYIRGLGSINTFSEHKYPRRGGKNPAPDRSIYLMNYNKFLENDKCKVKIK